MGTPTHLSTRALVLAKLQTEIRLMKSANGRVPIYYH